MEDFFNETLSILDQIEFEDLLEDGVEIENIMNGVVGKLYDNYKEYKSIWDQIRGTPLYNDLFSFIDKYDFLEYCSTRYDVDWKTETLYYCKRNKND